jgi:cytochrome b
LEIGKVMHSEWTAHEIGERAASVSPASANPAANRILLWDLPTRIFHWGLVAAVLTAVITGELGGSWMPVHAKAGLSIVGLLAFRITWGVIGSTYARFLHFAPTFGKIRAYLKGQWQGVGHNPLGALSVFALLGLLGSQVGTGLFANDDIDFTGPFFDLVDKALSNRLTGLHQQLAYVLIGLIALHLVAIVFYVRFKKENLVKPMVTGWKEVEAHSVKPVATVKGNWVALIVALIIAFAAVYVASGATLHKAPPPAPVSTTPAW